MPVVPPRCSPEATISLRRFQRLAGELPDPAATDPRRLLLRLTEAARALRDVETLLRADTDPIAPAGEEAAVADLPDAIVISVPILVPRDNPTRYLHSIEAMLLGYPQRRLYHLARIHPATQAQAGRVVVADWRAGARQLGAAYEPLPDEPPAYPNPPTPFPTARLARRRRG